MDTNNWRPPQAGEAPMDASDWRSQLHPDSRQRIVNKIFSIKKILKSYSPNQGKNVEDQISLKKKKLDNSKEEANNTTVTKIIFFFLKFRHRWTGRYEAYLWDKNCWNESQNKKGCQVYLAYDDEETAAHAYDLAALKYWGQDTILNFPLLTYPKELKEMEGESREEYIGSLRRKSSGFSQGVSKYRGVARHDHNGDGKLELDEFSATSISISGLMVGVSTT